MSGQKLGGIAEEHHGMHKGGLLHLPDKVNVRKKEMNMFSPTSF